jgi:hypothetical protein
MLDPTSLPLPNLTLDEGNRLAKPPSFGTTAQTLNASVDTDSRRSAG